MKEERGRSFQRGKTQTTVYLIISKGTVTGSKKALWVQFFAAVMAVAWLHLLPKVYPSTPSPKTLLSALSPSLRPSFLLQSSNELKGQSTNKTISRNESLRCVNALLIPVSKFHPPAVCCPLMRNKTPRSGEGGWGNGSMLGLLHSRHTRARTCTRAHTQTHTLTFHLTHTHKHYGCAGCYSRTEACFQPCDSAGLIKEHISICSHSASAQCLPIKCTHTHTHTQSSSVSSCHLQGDKKLDSRQAQINMLWLKDMIWPLTELSCDLTNEVQTRFDLVAQSHYRIWGHCRQDIHCVCVNVSVSLLSLWPLREVKVQKVIWNNFFHS